jgi:hypothetical protein
MRALLFVVAIATVGCIVKSDPTTPTTPPYSDAGTCAEAQKNGIALGCITDDPIVGPDGVAGTEDDSTFEERCDALKLDFPDIFGTGCFIESKSCEEFDGCATGL